MFYSLFAQHAQTQPGKVAVLTEGRQITYGELDALIERTAKNLIAFGVGPNTSITTCFSNGIEYLAFVYAIARIGAKVVPLSNTLTVEEVERYCVECRPDYYAVQSPYLGIYTEVCRRLGQGTVLSSRSEPISLGDIFNSDAHIAIQLPREQWTQQEFVIQYTSGMAGALVRIVHTQAEYVQRIQDWVQTGGLTADDRTLCMLSLAHAHDTDMLAFPALASGQTLILVDIANVTPEWALKTISEEQITTFGSLSRCYKEMLALPECVAADLSSLRIALCGAAPLSQKIVDDFCQRYGVRVNNSCGLTEDTAALVVSQWS